MNRVQTIQAVAVAILFFEAVRLLHAQTLAASTLDALDPSRILVPITRQMKAANGVPFGMLYDLGLVADNNSRASYEAASRIDSDGDGRFDWQEYIAGTIATNSASFFTVALSNATQLVWTPVPGREYGVATAAALDAQMHTLTNGLTAGTFRISATNPAAFYRVEVTLP